MYGGERITGTHARRLLEAPSRCLVTNSVFHLVLRSVHIWYGLCLLIFVLLCVFLHLGWTLIAFLLLVSALLFDLYHLLFFYIA